MSIEGNQNDSLANLSHQAVGQIRFDPSEKLQEKFAKLYRPAKSDLARRSLFLSSQYKLVTRQGPGGVLRGKDGQIAERLKSALHRGGNRNNHLGNYMRVAEGQHGEHDFLAFQFAVHLDRQIIHAINSDELLNDQPIIHPRRPDIKVILVFDIDVILDGLQRERAIRSIGRYVTGGQDIIAVSGGESQQKSPNSEAYTTNARLTFTSLRHDRPH